MAFHQLEPDNNSLNTLDQFINMQSNETMEDWNSLKDKNDNLEPAAVQEICRTCLNLIETSLNNFDNLAYIENLISICLPNLDLRLTKSLTLCKKCFSKLEEFSNFTESCLKIEKELINYCTANNILGPLDLSEFSNRLIKDSDKVDIIAIKEEDCAAGAAENDELNTILSPNFKSEEDSDIPLNELSSALKRTKKTVRKKKPIVARKSKMRGPKGHFSSDLIKLQVKCETCGQKFNSKWALDRHIPVHNTQNMNFACETCGAKFKYKHSFEKHAMAHLTGAPVTKPFACACGRFFNRMSKLKKHQENHVKKEKPFGCKSCGKRFIDEKLLEGHIERVHMNEKPFGCEMCGNKYTSKAGLDVHFKTHLPSDKPRPEPDLMCDICGKLFYRKYSLEKHHMSHTGDKPHECDQCNMKFKERYQLTIHMRRHTGEKPFKCEVCNFKFPSKNRLGVHMRIHTGVRPFQCQLCEMAFTRNDHLIKHVRAIHTGERPFECDICSKTFNRKDYLLKHKKVHSKKSL